VPSNLAVRRNMIVSREEAFGLLSKWKSESIPVAGLLRVDGVGVTFGGFITDLQPQGFVVAQMLESGRKAVEVLIGFDKAEGFEYQDLREAPPDLREKLQGSIAALMAIKLPTADCCLYEMMRPDTH
jgi:hypothetical protein